MYPGLSGDRRITKQKHFGRLEVGDFQRRCIGRSWLRQPLTCLETCKRKAFPPRKGQLTCSALPLACMAQVSPTLENKNTKKRKKKGLQGGTWKKDGKCPRVKNEPQRGSQLGTDDFHKARSERKTKTKTNKQKKTRRRRKACFRAGSGRPLPIFLPFSLFPLSALPPSGLRCMRAGITATQALVNVRKTMSQRESANRNKAQTRVQCFSASLCSCGVEAQQKESRRRFCFCFLIGVDVVPLRFCFLFFSRSFRLRK